MPTICSLTRFGNHRHQVIIGVQNPIWTFEAGLRVKKLSRVQPTSLADGAGNHLRYSQFRIVRQCLCWADKLLAKFSLIDNLFKLFQGKGLSQIKSPTGKPSQLAHMSTAVQVIGQIRSKTSHVSSFRAGDLKCNLRPVQVAEVKILDLHCATGGSYLDTLARQPIKSLSPYTNG